MKTALVIAGLVILAVQANAHRLDEYLQATTLSLEKDRVQAEIRLTPGVAVLPFVLASIDTDGNGVISEAEQRGYADRVLQDLSLSVDGVRLQPRLVSIHFPEAREIEKGLGEILIVFTATLGRRQSSRTLVFENHHQSRIAAYLANCLVPADPDIRVTAQNRNYQQSRYQLDYIQAGSGPISGAGGWLAAGVALILCTRLAWLNWRSSGTAA